jgi:formylglycine-generating enzyme required for sulfatase activity
MTNSSNETGKKGNQVFISYADNDRNIADMIYSALDSKGIRGWAAHRDIAPGLNWPDEISKAITGSKILILVLSSNTQKSRYVSMEVTQAEDENIIIIPFCIEEVPLRGGLKLLLGNRHWINAFPKPQEKHLDQLVETVIRHLGKAPPMPPEVVKEIIRKEEIKRKKPRPHKQILIAVSIIILLIAAVFLISQLDKAMPVDVKTIKSKALKENIKIEIMQNQKGFWEAYYEKYDITMIYIPPGKFKMGSDDGADNEKPPHEVDLDGYWIGKTEVTNAQYVEFLNDSKIDHKNGCQGKPCIDTDKESEYSHIKGTKGNYHVVPAYEKHPVIKVSWYGAIEYCKWLSKKTGLKFDLPTEAQWEKAARGQDKRKYPWGSREPDKNLANFDGNIGKTTPVGSYPAGASPYGLLDMAGNVWEWCSDRYAANYYKNSPPKNPEGPNSGSYRVVRGGSWYDGARDLRCANRSGYGPSGRGSGLGFRLRQDI